MLNVRPMLFVLTAFLALSGCAAAVQTPPDDAAAFPDLTDDPVPADARIIDVVADNTTMTPTEITVQMGETAALRITASEGDHAFQIPTLNVPYKPVFAGESVVIGIPTERAGVFEIACGPMHPLMRGTIVVQE